MGFPFRAGRWVDAAGTKDGHGNGETVEDRSAEPVIADEKMSEIAGVEVGTPDGRGIIHEVFVEVSDRLC